MHILNEHFDRIYVLYISHFELERIKYKLNKIGLKVEYFKGVNGKLELVDSFTDYYEKNKELKSKSYLKTIGAFGHIHSMIKILNNAILKKYKRILILEPDIYFASNFDVNKYLSADYKLLYLGASQHNWTKIDSQQKKNLNLGLYYPIDTFGTFAIGINNSIFNEYLEILKKMENPSDVCLFPIHKKYPQQCIVIYPNLISCDVTKSSTASRHRFQNDLMKKFRWDIDYGIYDRFAYKVNQNSIYRIVIEINYIYKKENAFFKISDEHNDITPTIFIPNHLLCVSKIKDYEGKQNVCDEYIIYVYSTSNKLFLYLHNIYVDNVYFIEYFKNINNRITTIYPHFEQKISKYINSKNNELIIYYDKMLSQLRSLNNQ